MRGKLSQILPWPPIQMYGRQRIMTNHDGGTFPYGRAALRGEVSSVQTWQRRMSIMMELRHQPCLHRKPAKSRTSLRSFEAIRRGSA